MFSLSLLLRSIYRQRSVIYSLLKVAVVVVLLVAALGFLRNSLEDRGIKTYKELRERLVELQGENVGAKLDALQRQFGEDSCTAAYNYYQSVYGRNGLDELAYDISRERTAQFDLAGVVRGYADVDEQQRQFLSMLSVVYNTHRGDAALEPEVDKLVKQHAAILEAAKKKGGSTRRAVGSSAVGAMMYHFLQMDEKYRSDADWEVYCRQYQWMQTAIPMLFAYSMTEVDELLGVQAAHSQGGVQRMNPEIAKRFVELCATYPEFNSASKHLTESFESALKSNACTDEDGVAEISALAASMAYTYRMFDLYGQEVDALCRHGLDAVEVLDVLLCNRDLLNEDKRENRMALFFKDVEDVRSNSDLWNFVRCTPCSLRILRANPKYASKVIKSYAHVGVPTLLVACSMCGDGAVDMDVLHNAVTALHQYKEMAVYVMNQCGEDRRFGIALKKDYRSVAYMAKRVDSDEKKDEALERLCSTDGASWLNKELNTDGAPKGESWIQYLPGGALANVVMNWAKGYPNEWSEVGWAMVDVAEGVALVATLGTSGAASATIRAGSAAAKACTKTVATSASKALGKSLAVRGSRLLGRMAFVAKGFALSVAKKSCKVIQGVPKALLKLLKTRAAYKWAGLGLLGIELGCRTLPHMDDIAEGASATITKALADAACGLAEGTTKGIMDCVAEKYKGVGVGLNFFIGLILLLSSVGFGYFFMRKRQSQRIQLTY